jgi:hypothetical protein
MTSKHLALWFALVTALGLHGRLQIRAEHSLRCAMDGARIEPIYQVDLVRAGSVVRSFCSMACARAWPEVLPGAYWQLRDEVTGSLIDAERAHFVASRVETVPSRHESVHVFTHWEDAQAHVERHGGIAVANPFEPVPGAAEPRSEREVPR